MRELRQQLFGLSEFSVDAIVDFLRNWYYEKQQGGIGLKPYALEIRMKQVFQLLPNLRVEEKCDIHQQIRDFARNVALQHSYHVKRAPVVSLKKLTRIAKSMWKMASSQTRKFAQYKYRMSATMLNFCTFSGSRWVDSSRLFWEDLIGFEKNIFGFVR